MRRPLSNLEVCALCTTAWTFLTCLLFLFLGRPAPSAPRPEPACPDPAALACRAWKVETVFGHGTAWPLCRVGKDRWVFVTAGHVVDDGEVGERVVCVRDCEGRTLRALASATSGKDVDCAVILVEGDRMPVDCLSISDRKVSDGEQVWLGSWPGGDDLYVTTGYTLHTYLHQNVSCQALPGSSGGPVLDSTGLVVGILTRIWLDNTGERVAYMAVMQPAVTFGSFIGSGVALLAGFP